MNDMKLSRRCSLICGLLVTVLLVYALPAFGAMKKVDDAYLRRLALRKVTATPNTQNCSHRVGNVHFTITNWGFFGSQYADPDWLLENYCLDPSDPDYGQQAPSFEFPAGSGINYLFQGALWLGAIVDEDTLVSVGADGWQRVNEMYPEAAPNGNIVQLSTRKTSPYYSEDAVSEQDFYAEYTDTLVDEGLTGRDAVDNRPHKPLNVKVLQRSYAWSFSYAEDFVLVDYKLVNIGERDLKKAFMALYVDADIWKYGIDPNGFADDISGYLLSHPSPACDKLIENINVAWTADNDGDPADGVFKDYSPTGVAGTRVVRSPNPDLRFSFNWWVSNGDASLDWGPRRQENNRDFGGFLGTPEGDRNKYYIMSQPEFDYDQIYAAVDQSAQGWLPPNKEIANDLADGFDTRYLFSFGPFDIPPGDTLPITIAYVAGDKFHQNPHDFESFDPQDPDVFYKKLNFTDLVTNAQWAGWVYDNPGIDTDQNGVISINPDDPHINPCTGEQYYADGDGVPDFAGPPPPSPPIIRFEAEPGKVVLHWNGKLSETEDDPFSFKKDFEGYRVYMADRPVLSDFALLTSYDLPDYDRYHLNTAYDPPFWELTEIPFSLEELRAIYGNDFQPLDYGSPANALEWNTGTSIEHYYFTTQDYNRSTLGAPGTIKKAYPDAQPGDMVWAPKLQDSVDAYYEYEYEIDGLLSSQPKYFAVSTFDYGNPSTNLGPLESSPLANMIKVYPLYSADQVAKQGLGVKVFPNPYRVDAGYAEAGYEKPGEESNNNPTYARRIWFSNLPAKATIRIYTLDGDLVRELQHPCGCKLQAGESMMAWDLITRNTQAAVSGIYLYTVESDLGTQVGKFVVIK